MRFPWLQVDADFIGAHAGDLGAHLGIGRREAMGLALDLWTWALARAGDDAPPDGLVAGTGAVPDRLLAGSVGWTGPAEEFSAALVAVGLAVRVADGYRLSGFSRYKATWEKNRRRSGVRPDRNRTGTGEEPARKTQTQTQTQKEASASQANAAASPGDDLPNATAFALEAQEPPTPAAKKSREIPPGEVLYMRLEDSRKAECTRAGVPFVPSRWPFSRQNKDLGSIARLPDGHEEQKRFQAAWVAFLEDPQARDLDEPFSLSFFWRMRSRYEGRGLRAAS